MYKKLASAITNGDTDYIQTIIIDSLKNGEKAEELLSKTMVPTMRKVGDKYQRGEIFIPEMLMAASAMQVGLDSLEDALTKENHKKLGKVSIGTVKGDLHDIGKNLVALTLKGAGYEVEDLGIDCDISKYKEAVENGAQAVLCSALLTTTMPYMKFIVDQFEDNPNVKIVIGGAPVTNKFAKQINADGYSEDAYSAINTVEKLLSNT